VGSTAPTFGNDTPHIIDAYGLKDTRTETIYVGSTAPTSGDDTPHITDLPIPKKVYQLDPTDFTATATSTLDAPLTYTWDFGDGTPVVEGQSVKHTFANSGEYQATLTVVDGFGSKDTKIATIYVGSTAPVVTPTVDPNTFPNFDNNPNNVFKNG